MNPTPLAQERHATISIGGPTCATLTLRPRSTTKGHDRCRTDRYFRPTNPTAMREVDCP